MLRSLAKITQPVSGRENWDLSSGCPALDSPAHALSQDTRQRLRGVGGSYRGWGDGAGGGAKQQQEFPSPEE